MGLKRPDFAELEDGLSTYVLIDGDSVTRCVWEAAGGECVQILERRLRSLASAWPKSKLFIAWDGEKSDEYRRRFYPGYKAGRSDPGDAYRILRSNVPALAARIGYTSYTAERAEADDIVGSLCRAALTKGDRVVVVSADKDLFQLLTDSRVKQLRNFTTAGGAMGESNYMTSEGFARKYGVTPAQWPLYKSLVGDATDCIPGVRDVGEGMTAKLFAQFPDLTLGNIAGKLAATPTPWLNTTRRQNILDSVASGELAAFVRITTLIKLAKTELIKLS